MCLRDSFLKDSEVNAVFMLIIDFLCVLLHTFGHCTVHVTLDAPDVLLEPTVNFETVCLKKGVLCSPSDCPLFTCAGEPQGRGDGEASEEGPEAHQGAPGRRSDHAGPSEEQRPQQERDLAAQEPGLRLQYLSAVSAHKDAPNPLTAVFSNT